MVLNTIIYENKFCYNVISYFIKSINYACKFICSSMLTSICLCKIRCSYIYILFYCNILHWWYTYTFICMSIFNLIDYNCNCIITYFLIDKNMFSILRIFAGSITELMFHKVTNKRFSVNALRTILVPWRTRICSNFDGHFRIFLDSFKLINLPFHFFKEPLPYQSKILSNYCLIIKDIKDENLINSSQSLSDYRQSDYYNLTLISIIQLSIHLQ